MHLCSTLLWIAALSTAVDTMSNLAQLWVRDIEVTLMRQHKAWSSVETPEVSSYWWCQQGRWWTENCFQESSRVDRNVPKPGWCIDMEYQTCYLGCIYTCPSVSCPKVYSLFSLHLQNVQRTTGDYQMGHVSIVPPTVWGRFRWMKEVAHAKTIGPLHLRWRWQVETPVMVSRCCLSLIGCACMSHPHKSQLSLISSVNHRALDSIDVCSQIVISPAVFFRTF